MTGPVYTENGSPAMLSEIRSYLSGRRMCSVQNLALHFNQSLDTIWQIIAQLEKQGYVRMAQKKCGDSCDSCNTDCSSGPVDATAIIISLEKSGEDDDGQ